MTPTRSARDATPSPGAFDGPYRQVLLSSHEAIVLVDESQTVVGFNPAAEVMFGCSAGEALTQPLSRFVPNAQCEAHEASVRRFAASKAYQHKIAPGRRITALRADGSERPVEVTLSRVDAVVAGQTRQWFAALLRDLSTEHALRDEVDVMTRRLYAALDATPVAVWIAEDERIIYANRLAGALMGQTSDALRGQALAALLPAATLAALRAAVTNADAGPVARVRGQLAWPDGSLRDIEIAVAPLPDHGHSVIQMVIEDVTQRLRADSARERASQDLRRLQASVIEAREEERRRISRELHDELGQRLTALKMDVAGLAQRADATVRDERIAGMLAMLDETVAAVRRIASDLRPLMLDDLGLNAAIEWLARDTARRTGIAIDVRLGDTTPPVAGRTATALYRMVQEALTNVVRHARAQRVTIDLHRDGNHLLLAVVDDGVGLPAADAVRDDAYGLMGMRERAAMLGGTLALDSPAGGGARLVVRLPIVLTTQDAA